MRKMVIYGAIVTLIMGFAYFLAHANPTAEPAPDVQANPPAVQGRLTGYTILVDAGHGGYDGGARAGVTKVWEKEINLQVALALGKALEAEGARVLLTRTEDKAFADKKRPDLDARLQMAQQARADMLLSVHMNQYHSAKESGPQVFYRKNHADSRLLAGAIQASMILQLQPKKERKAMAGDYYMLSLDIPSVLVECGFLSNPEEEALLMDETYQQKLAQAVCDGVCEYTVLKTQEKNRAAQSVRPVFLCVYFSGKKCSCMAL